VDAVVVVINSLMDKIEVQRLEVFALRKFSEGTPTFEGKP